MSFRSRGLSAALAMGLLGLLAGEVQAAMTLEFAITPIVQPLSGSLDKDAAGTIVATNLAVTSVTSVQSAKVMPLSKYLDLQSAGITGANFFILDGLVQQYHGSLPVAMSSPITSTSLVATATGYLFSMVIKDASVSNQMAANFGATGGAGWTGVLTLNIAAFNSALAGNQVTSGTLFLTSPTIASASAGETVTAPTTTTPPITVTPVVTLAPAVVPEPSSLLMAGIGLLLGAARFRSVMARSKP